MAWLNVTYNYSFYDIASTDQLIAGALGRWEQRNFDSGACVGGPPERELNFWYETKADAEAARRELDAAGLPVTYETSITGRDEEEKA